MKMIEKVGLAISKASVDVRIIYGVYDFSTYPGNAAPHVVKNDYSREELYRGNDKEEAFKIYQNACRDYITKAAIEAMREPTEKMKKEGAVISEKYLGADETVGYDGAEHIWEMMIDAALKE